MLMRTLSILPVRLSPQQSFTTTIKYAGVAELADAPDLGSGGTPVQVQVLSPAPNNRNPIFRVSVVLYME